MSGDPEEYAEYTDDEDLDFSEVGLDDSPDKFESIPDDDYDPDHESVIGDDATQHMLLSYLNSNQALFIRCSPILKEEYFDDEFQSVVTLMKEYERVNQVMPNPLVVRADTGVDLAEPDDASHPTVEDAIAVRVEEFCRFAAADLVLSEAYETIHNGDKSRSTMSHFVSEMERVTSISVNQDMGLEYHTDMAKALEEAERTDALPTGFAFLDLALNGGVTQPSFNLVSAASGGGKSIYLQNQAINYIRQGHNVVYVSLELSEAMIMKRFAAIGNDTDINSLYHYRDQVVMKTRSAAKREGRLKVKKFKISGTTVADIRAFVNELISDTGEEWNHIMIDYMDLMSPVTPGIRADNIHLKDKAISEELYDWAHDKIGAKIIWSASQQVKGAKDEKDARQSGVAGGTGKVNTSDNLLILKRSREDIQDERCWGFIEKGRNGGTGMRIPFQWDTETQRMTNPEDLEDLFVEANIPGGDEQKEEQKKKTKLSVDPIARAKAAGETAASQEASKTKSRIMANRAKRNQS